MPKIPRLGKAHGVSPQREYAEKCLPSHVSRLLPSRTRVITVLKSASFQAKGSERFSRRGGIQKNPQEMRISLRKKGAFLPNNPLGSLLARVMQSKGFVHQSAPFRS